MLDVFQFVDFQDYSPFSSIVRSSLIERPIKMCLLFSFDSTANANAPFFQIHPAKKLERSIILKKIYTLAIFSETGLNHLYFLKLETSKNSHCLFWKISKWWIPPTSFTSMMSFLSLSHNSNLLTSSILSTSISSMSSSVLLSLRPDFLASSISCSHSSDSKKFFTSKIGGLLLSLLMSTFLPSSNVASISSPT